VRKREQLTNLRRLMIDSAHLGEYTVRVPKLIAAFVGVHLFGITASYLVQHPSAALGHSMERREKFSRKTFPDGVLDAVEVTA
jgi:hypothetical protein